MRPTLKDAAVIYVDGDGKTAPGVIHEAFTPGAARIQFADKSSAQAAYSENGEPGTFHYADQKDLVADNQKKAAAKKSAAPIGKPNPTPEAAAPATDKSGK